MFLCSMYKRLHLGKATSSADSAYRNLFPIQNQSYSFHHVYIGRPTNSHKFISFIKLIRVASMALAAYSHFSRRDVHKYYIEVISRKRSVKFTHYFLCSFCLTPTITLSGLMKSCIAAPSLRNSGFDTISKS